jgi:diadenosine tetraphosphatase ApaH/serine/threonine PP2A family protein phosphatase
VSGGLALLYDVHGNVPALESVLAECEAAGADRYLLGGDYAAFGPWPRETVERLDELPAVAWIRGNGERWLVEEPEVPAEMREFARAALDAARAELGADRVRRLYSLPTDAEVDGVLYCHGSPLSDVESFAAESKDGEERMLAEVRDRTVVFGHSHVQFRRPGPDATELLNPGSVGMPLDGDRRAAWGLRRADGSFELRRTEYDVERAVARLRSLGDWADALAHRLEHGSD